MATLKVTKDQFDEMQTKLTHHKDALRSLCWGGADIATLRRSHADLRQVQPAYDLAFDKLVELLDDEDEYETAHEEFCTVFSRADYMSREIRELMNDNMEILLFS